jgi:hypothetical protein
VTFLTNSNSLFRIKSVSSKQRLQNEPPDIAVQTDVACCVGHHLFSSNLITDTVVESRQSCGDLLNCDAAVPVTTILNKPAVSICTIVSPKLLVAQGHISRNLKS